MNIKLIPLLLFGVFSITVGNGQTKSEGQTYVSNDYREVPDGSVIIKWYALKVYYPEGFNVYRQQEGQQEWVKLNKDPINVSKDVSEELHQKDNELRPFLKVVHDTPYDKFQKSVARVFLVIKAVKNPIFAELLGIIYYDQKAVAGANYKYRVMGIESGQEVFINDSPAITAGLYQPISAPEGVTIERLKGKVTINWQPEELRYYGVNVYRKTGSDAEWVKLNDQPRSVHKTANQKGERVYPDVFYEDIELNDDELYTYRLTAMDFFGQESISTDEVMLSPVDFDAPLAPLNVHAEVDFFKVDLSWDAVYVDDLAGFNVYMADSSAGIPKRLNGDMLPVNAVSFNYELDKADGYYFSVAAVDQAGNESTTRIFVDVRDVTPPAKPLHVTVETEPGSVKLYWHPNTETDLLGYHVYRTLEGHDHDKKHFIIVNPEPTTDNFYIEEHAHNVRNKFTYAIVAVDKSLNRSEMSDPSHVQLPDVTPPKPPVIINITTYGQYPIVEWLPTVASDLAGYNIYRSNQADTAFSKLNINPYPIDVSKYTDRNSLAAESYFYYATAIDDAGNESVASNIYALSRRPGTGEELIFNKVDASYLPEGKKVELTWNVSPVATMKGSVIYRKQENGKLIPLTGLLDSQSYSDKSIKKGNDYYYEIRAYSKTGAVVRAELLKVIISE